jgi:hypothetical protein
MPEPRAIVRAGMILFRTTYRTECYIPGHAVVVTKEFATERGALNHAQRMRSRGPKRVRVWEVTHKRIG